MTVSNKPALRAPKAMRCRYIKATCNDKGIVLCGHSCLDCGTFTGNIQLYRYEVCSAKERRKRKVGRRANDRWRNR